MTIGRYDLVIGPWRARRRKYEDAMARRRKSNEFELRVHISCDGPSPSFSELPSRLQVGESLESDLDQVKDCIRAWLESVQENEEMEVFSVTIAGPFGRPVAPLPTPEQRLEEAEKELSRDRSASSRFHLLGRAAQDAFESQHFEKAREYATELERLLPNFSDHEFGDENYACHFVLGRLAIRDGDLEEAERRLLLAGGSEGSPALGSFGPDMDLAQDLLREGRREVVLEFFAKCGRFWEDEDGFLKQWAQDVREGRMPDFDAKYRH